VSERVSPERLKAVLGYALKGSENSLNSLEYDLANDLRDCRAERDALRDSLKLQSENCPYCHALLAERDALAREVRAWRDGWDDPIRAENEAAGLPRE
jgi:hypothetical protein